MRFTAIGSVLGVNLALAGALAFLWSDEARMRWTEPEALPPSLEDVVAAPAAEPVDVSRYRETIERPLFASTRRVAPRTEQSAEAQAAVDALKDVRLLGTYEAGGRGGIVVLRGGKVQRVAIGESIGGWKVAGGGEGRSAALVRASGERRQLELALNTAAPAAPAAAGKASGQEEEKAPATAPAAPAARGQPGASERAAAAAAPSTGAASGASRDEVRQRNRELRNQRRAERGLPPLTK